MFEDCYQRINDKIKPDVQLVEKTIGLAHQSRKRFKLVPATMLIVFIVLISATALAAKVTTGDWLGFLIQMDNPVDLEELLSEPGESIVCGDHRITLQSAVGDGTAYYILLDVDTVSGAPLYDYPLRQLSETMPSNIHLIYLINADLDGFGIGATHYRVDDGNDPSKATMIIRAELSYSGKAPKWIEFNILSINGIIQAEEAPDQRNIAEGSWRFVISGKTDTKAVTYRISDAKVRITPLSLSIRARSAPFDLDPRSGIQVEMDDGSLMAIPHIGIRTGFDGFFTDWEMTAIFNSIIDPMRVVAIHTENERIAFKER
ncbi:MAG: hypothetical protein SCM11_17355 [Bacillota bacterium]|nr:hypothetical protein [Bacillota bacterium]